MRIRVPFLYTGTHTRTHARMRARTYTQLGAEGFAAPPDEEATGWSAEQARPRPSCHLREHAGRKQRDFLACLPGSMGRSA